MIQFKSLVQYTRVVDGIRFRQNINEPFLLVYFSENSRLMDDYPKLNLRKVDAKHVVLPTTRIPITRITGAYRKIFKMLGLLPFSDKMAFPKNRNILYDTTIFTSEVDRIYKPAGYRQRAGILIKSILFDAFASFTKNYKKVLIYSIDITKPTNNFLNRKLYRKISFTMVYFL